MIGRPHTFLVFATVVFTIVLIGFGILHGMMFLFSGFMEPSERDEFYLRIVCGTIYLLGSVLVFRRLLSTRSMLFYGALLNGVGAVVWIPTMGTRDALFAVTGAILTAIWIFCIFQKIKFGEQGAEPNRVAE